MRRAAKRDANEAEIIAALKNAGCTVTQLSQRGVLDLLVGYCGHWLLLEVKSDDGKLTDDQRQFIEYHTDCPLAVVRTPTEALIALQSLLPRCTTAITALTEGFTT